MTRFYFRLKAEVIGPISGVELREAAFAGIVSAATPIATSPRGPWTNARNARGLFDQRARPLSHPPETVPPTWIAQGPQGSAGPFQLHEIVQLIQRGTLSPSSLVQREPDGQWMPAEAVSPLVPCALKRKPATLGACSDAPVPQLDANAPPPPERGVPPSDVAPEIVRSPKIAPSRLGQPKQNRPFWQMVVSAAVALLVTIVASGIWLFGRGEDEGNTAKSMESDSEAAAFMGEPLESWIAQLQSEEQATRAKAAKAIAGIGKPAVPAVLDLVENTAPGDLHRSEIAMALGALGEDVVPGLVEMLESDDRASRMRAAASLGAMGSAAETAIPNLVKAATQKSLTDFKDLLGLIQEAGDNPDADVKERSTQTIEDIVGVQQLAMNALESIGREAIIQYRNSVTDDNLKKSTDAALTQMYIPTAARMLVELDSWMLLAMLDNSMIRSRAASLSTDGDVRNPVTVAELYERFGAPICTMEQVQVMTSDEKSELGLKFFKLRGHLYGHITALEDNGQIVMLKLISPVPDQFMEEVRAVQEQTLAAE